MQVPEMLLAKVGHKNCFKRSLQIAGSITSPQHKISLIPEFLLKGQVLLDLIHCFLGCFVS